MDFVENDWAALRWAIGGLVALLKSTGLADKNLTDEQGQLHHFEMRIRHAIVITRVLYVIDGLVFGVLIFTSANVPQRIGSCLIVASTILFFGFQLCLQTAGESSEATGDLDPLACLRLKLKQRSGDLVGINFAAQCAAFVPGWLLFVIGFAASHPEIETDPVLLAPSVIVAIALTMLGLVPNIMLRPCPGCGCKRTALRQEPGSREAHKIIS
jgi:hypothetical protein